MPSVSDNIKIQLILRKMSIEELCKRAKLTRPQIDNIVCNRSQKLENIQKIALALHVPLEHLIGTTSLSKDFDPIFYTNVVKIVNELLNEKPMDLAKDTIDHIAIVLGKNRRSIKDEQELKLMIRGMLLYIGDIIF